MLTVQCEVHHSVASKLALTCVTQHDFGYSLAIRGVEGLYIQVSVLAVRGTCLNLELHGADVSLFRHVTLASQQLGRDVGVPTAVRI